MHHWISSSFYSVLSISPLALSFEGSNFNIAHLTVLSLFLTYIRSSHRQPRWRSLWWYVLRTKRLPSVYITLGTMSISRTRLRVNMWVSVEKKKIKHLYSSLPPDDISRKAQTPGAAVFQVIPDFCKDKIILANRVNWANERFHTHCQRYNGQRTN